MVAVTTGSAEDSLRVKLLSMPQAIQAAAMSAAPASGRTPPPLHVNTTAPAMMVNAPRDQPPINVLPEHHPGDQHGCQPFEIEQKRSGRGGGVRQPNHQQERTGHPAEQYHRS